jgi:hypothetical protein
MEISVGLDGDGRPHLYHGYTLSCILWNELEGNPDGTELTVVWLRGSSYIPVSDNRRQRRTFRAE